MRILLALGLLLGCLTAASGQTLKPGDTIEHFRFSGSET